METDTKKPRITLLARADNTGLGSQTWEFYRHMKPHRTFVLDLNSINQTIGKKTALHMERFPDARVIEGFPMEHDVENILEDTDILFSIETFYNYKLVQDARKKGVKTVLQYNYEFLDYLALPSLPMPDMLLAPSVWHLDTVQTMGKITDTQVRYINVPTNRKVLPYRKRTHAKNFLHVAGHRTYMDRNGTLALLQSLGMVKSQDIKITIFSQFPIDALEDPRIIVKHMDVENYWEIYNGDHDVLILPRRYGGLSLQLNEALCVGMPVIMTDVEPQNSFLPMDMLIETDGVDVIQTRTAIDCYKPKLSSLAAKIDELATDPDTVISLSEWANWYSEQNSWEALKPVYDKTFMEVWGV